MFGVVERWGDTGTTKGKASIKPNSSHDFISCAEYLIDNRYTVSDTLIICGSARFLMGARLNQRPELFGGCVAEVPFVDVTTYNA